MGIMDKVKGLLKGRETQVKKGIDTVSDQAEKAVGTKHAAKVDAVSDKAKDAVDNLTKDSAPATTTATTPPVTPVTPAAPATPVTPVTPPDVPPAT